MLFNSLTFLVFFVVVFALHQLLPGWTQREQLLLVASDLFYAAWHPPYALILFFSTTLDWWLARAFWLGLGAHPRTWRFSTVHAAAKQQAGAIA